MSHITQPKPQTPTTPTFSTSLHSKISLVGQRILLVEDNALIAMQAELTLEDAGVKVIGPVGQVDLALRLAEKELLDGALLDIDLHGKYTWEVADQLMIRNIPFVFTSGFAGAALPSRFEKVLSIAKPYTEVQLIDALDAMLGGRVLPTAAPFQEFGVT